VLPSDAAYPVVWSDPDPVRRSRWVVFGRDREGDLTDRELEAMCETVEAIEIAEERATALAIGEDITSLDDTDFLIRAIRRDRATAARNLRSLYIHATPYPEVHYQPRVLALRDGGDTPWKPIAAMRLRRRHGVPGIYPERRCSDEP
jgi:hypothetical protein